MQDILEPTNYIGFDFDYATLGPQVCVYAIYPHVCMEYLYHIWYTLY